MIFNLCNPVTSPDWGDYPQEQQSTYSWTLRARDRPVLAHLHRRGLRQRRSSSRTCCATTTRTRGTPRPPARGTSTTRTTSAPELGMTDQRVPDPDDALVGGRCAAVIAQRRPRTLQPELASTSSPTPTCWRSTRTAPASRRGRVGPAGTTETWVKPLADGSQAVALLNRGDRPAQVVTTTARAAGLPRRSVRRCWTRGPTGVTADRRHDPRRRPGARRALFRVRPARGRAGDPHVIARPAAVSRSAEPRRRADGRPTVVAAGDQLPGRGRGCTNDGCAPVAAPAVTLTAPAGWTVTRTGSAAHDAAPLDDSRTLSPSPCDVPAGRRPRRG